ncbi:MAG: bifunctional metallophosphatase/5'-nucleotidase [Proteobacteria bacterium]|nr:bifunctional metallophosphatase/5'-nucleotidase [Pseudomonadota bacterium]
MRRLAPIAVFALLCVSCLEGSGAPDLDGVPVRLTILHTGDIHSRILPYAMVPQFTDQELGLEEGKESYGGAPQIATILKDERAASGRSLHLDSGDYFQGAPIFNLFDGEVEMRVMSKFGVDAAIAGNHEFDAGARNYATQIEQWADFRVLGANYDFASSNDPWNSRLDGLIDPYAIFDVDGLTVGVVGMANLSSITSIHEADNSMDVTALPTLSTLEFYTGLIEPQVDLVVVMTHLGLDDDELIARTNPHVDLVLGGHLHVAFDPIKVIPSEAQPGKDVIISAAGAFAKFVQRVDIVVKDGDIVAHDSRLIPIMSDIPPDPEMEELLEDYVRELEDTINLEQPVAHTTDRLRRFGNSGGDSPLGNLVAEAMQYRSGIETDFGMTNSLGIRTDIQGPANFEDVHVVTIEELFNVLPFDNTITTMFLSGAEVQALFDYIASRSASRGCSTQAQISSARFVMDCANEVGVDITIGGSWDECESDEDCEISGEICSANACGRPIAPTESYELATNNYIAQGGSGFFVLENNTTQEDSGISMRDAVRFFMQDIADGDSIPLNQLYPSGDGRITPRF